MAEKESKRMGWFKAIIGTTVGLMSGAVGMYISPLIDRVVKPNRPLANFAVETDGLTATFHNRYAGEGWWDFGDGTPLEPALPEQASISHTYAKPGTFPAKLMVRNFIGDEHERAVPIEVTVGSAATPAITSLEAFPVSSDRTAPATFRVVAQTTNAERLVWDMGGERPPEVAAAAVARHEKFITFVTPGEHVVQLTALNGNQAAKRVAVVRVEAPQPGMLVARLRVTDRGIRFASHTRTERVPIELTKNSASTIAFEKVIVAWIDSTITEAKTGEVGPAFRNVKAVIAPDKRSVRITGNLSPTTEMRRAANPPSIPVLVTQTRQSQMSGPATEVTAAIALPGSATLAMPPLPADVAQHQRTVILELRGANGFAWQQPVPTAGVVDWQGRRYTVKAVPAGSEVKIDVVQGGVGLTSTSK